MKKKLLTIGEAAKVLGLTTTTLRNWDKNGLLHPDEHTRGGNRRYKLESLKSINPDVRYKTDDLKTIAYARVSSNDHEASTGMKLTDELKEYLKEKQ